MESIRPNEEYWMGQEYEQQFVWRSGERLQYTNWDSGEPNDAESCLRVIVSTGEWRDFSCSSGFHSVCEKEADSAGHCASGWTFHAGHCYVLDSTDRSWFNAQANCEIMGANLAEISSAQEDAAVYALTTSSDAWVGASTPDFAARWVDESAFGGYSRWDSGDPESRTSKCGLSDKGEWKSKRCSDSKRFVCKLPKSALFPILQKRGGTWPIRSLSCCLLC